MSKYYRKDWNGPPREIRGDLTDELVYCVTCGNVFVHAQGRSCPTCTIAAELELGGDE